MSSFKAVRTVVRRALFRRLLCCRLHRTRQCGFGPSGWRSLTGNNAAASNPDRHFVLRTPPRAGPLFQLAPTSRACPIAPVPPARSIRLRCKRRSLPCCRKPSRRKRRWRFGAPLFRSAAHDPPPGGLFMVARRWPRVQARLSLLRSFAGSTLEESEDHHETRPSAS